MWANIESIRTEEVKPVDNTTCEFISTNCRILNSHPGYFGKIGMREFHLKQNYGFCPTVNVEKLWSLVPAAVLEEAKTKKDQSLVLDVTKHGYFKVLGKGKLPAVPIVVKAKYFSRAAEQRIKEVGGACVLVA